MPLCLCILCHTQFFHCCRYGLPDCDLVCTDWLSELLLVSVDDTIDLICRLSFFMWLSNNYTWKLSDNKKCHEWPLHCTHPPVRKLWLLHVKIHHAILYLNSSPPLIVHRFFFLFFFRFSFDISIVKTFILSKNHENQLKFPIKWNHLNN